MLFVYGVWHSLVVRLVRDQEAAGSNPVTPTNVGKNKEISPLTKGLIFFLKHWQLLLLL